MRLWSALSVPLDRSSGSLVGCLFVSLAFVSPAFVSLVGCRSVEVVDGGAASGAASGGVTSSSSAAAGGAGGACNLPPPPVEAQPTAPGCYENDMGSGWVAVPCGCELWLRDTTHAPLGASIELDVTGVVEAPSLTGAFEAGMDFDDADGAWFAAWKLQPGLGKVFSLTRSGDTTRVRLGESALTLSPVLVEPCATRKSKAFVSGPPMAKLAARAVLADGTLAETSCAQIPVTPPP